MNKAEFQRYMDAVEDNIRRHPEWTYGQALFNTLVLSPQWVKYADVVRDTKFDPYDAKIEGGTKVEDFFFWLASVDIEAEMLCRKDK